jgi:hypothetical protein
MHEENTNQHEKETASVIEDLTLEEAKSENVKGGPYNRPGYEWAKQVKA